MIQQTSTQICSFIAHATLVKGAPLLICSIITVSGSVDADADAASRMQLQMWTLNSSIHTSLAVIVSVIMCVVLHIDSTRGVQ